MAKTLFELTEGSAPLLTDLALTGEDPLNTHVLRRTTWQSIRNLFVGAPTAANDMIVGSASGAWGKKTLAETKVILGATSIGGVAHKQLWVGGWKPTLTSGCAQPAQIEMGTNKNVYDYLAFDKDTVEYAYANVPMPNDYTGGAVYAKFYWMHPATTTNFDVAWLISAAAIGDGGSLDVSLGIAGGIIDIGGSANTLYISNLSYQITPSGSPAAGKLIEFVAQRYSQHVNDTLAVDAYLLGVMFWYPVA